MGNLAYFNLHPYRDVQNLIVRFSPVLDARFYRDEVSADDSFNIYLFNSGRNYFLQTSEESIYLNDDMHSFAKGATQLLSTKILNKSVVNYKYVVNFHTAFTNCFRLENKPISTNNMTTMYGSYYNCSNIAGTPIVNKKVTNLIATYYNCGNLTGVPACNENVTMMIGTYYNCINLTGEPAIGPKVKGITDAYYNCYSLEGNPANCNNVQVAINAYYNVPNLYGTFYWYESNNTQASKINATNMFYNRDYTRQLNIYVKTGSSIENALINYSASFGNIYGVGAIDWTYSTSYYYNTMYNTYIYNID